jgi:hypothetical protein
MRHQWLKEFGDTNTSLIANGRERDTVHESFKVSFLETPLFPVVRISNAYTQWCFDIQSIRFSVVPWVLKPRRETFLKPSRATLCDILKLVCGGILPDFAPKFEGELPEPRKCS